MAARDPLERYCRTRAVAVTTFWADVPFWVTLAEYEMRKPQKYIGMPKSMWFAAKRAERRALRQHLRALPGSDAWARARGW